MTIIEIAAIGENLELGYQNDLIWHLKKDLSFFRQMTQNSVIVMGRKTFESLPKKLPGRHHVILSGTMKSDDPDLEIFADLPSFLQAYENWPDPIFVIGGGSIYAQMLPYAKYLILTQIQDKAQADTWFPNFDEKMYDRQVLTDLEENGICYKHILYSRK